MSIQRVIDNASSIQIDKRKLSGQTVSRSGRIKTLSVASVVPWQFTVSLADGLKYSTNRDLLSDLDELDRIFTERVNIGLNNPGLAYITQYRGELNESQIAGCTITSVTTQPLEIRVSVSHLTTVPSSRIMFRKGDIIQPGAYNSSEDAYLYPYTVTADVVRGTSSTVDIPIHRPFIPMNSVNVVSLGYGLRAGVNCNWNVKMVSKPSYSVIPYDRIGWSGDFELAEVVL